MKRAIVSILIICLIASSILSITNVAALPTGKQPVIVGFKDRPNADLIQAYGGNIKFEYTIIPAIACSLPEKAITALAKNPKIAYIEEDAEFFALASELDNSWGVKHIGAGVVHANGNTGVGVKVAVIDTGINHLHEELISSYKGGIDYVNGDDDPMDDHGHGTHCAGIIAAARDNNDVVVGVAPDAELYGVKVLDSNGGGSLSNILAGIQWSINNEMQIISMSLGSSSGSSSLEDACEAAYSAGIVVVAAAGNSGPARGRTISTVGYPARYSSVIAVGATDINNALASFSSTGPEVELVAPGVKILSTYIDVDPNDGPNIDTWTMSGTSMACPHVAGTAALILKTNEADWASLDYTDGNGVWSNAEVRKVLIETAYDLGATGKDNYYGYGLVDAYAASPTPSVDITPPTITNLTPADEAFINYNDPGISAIVSDASGINKVAMTLKITSTEEQILNQVNNYDTPYTGLVSFPATELADGKYTVSLTAWDASENSNYKTIIWSFTVDTEAPAKVTGLAITDITSSQLKLTWNLVEDETGYRIYRNDLASPITTTATYYLDTGLAASTTYTYYVEAVDKAGNIGPASEPESATTEPAPAIPTLHVQSVTVSLNYRSAGANRFYMGTATVIIIDANGQPVAGATVSGHWEGATGDIDSGTTNTAGTVALISDEVRNPKSETAFTFVVDNVALSGWTYEFTEKPKGSQTVP
jgi:subtilisin